MPKGSRRSTASLIIWMLTSLQCAALHQAVAQDRARSPHKQKRIEALVQMLASKNKAPIAPIQ